MLKTTFLKDPGPEKTRARSCEPKPCPKNKFVTQPIDASLSCERTHVHRHTHTHAHTHTHTHTHTEVYHVFLTNGLLTNQPMDGLTDGWMDYKKREKE